MGESDVLAFIDARENVHKTDDSLELWDLAFLGERGIDVLTEIAKNKQVPFLDRYDSISALLVNPASISRAEELVLGIDGVEKGFLAMRLARMTVNYHHKRSLRGDSPRSRVVIRDILDANPGEVYRAQSAIAKTVIRYEPARRFFTSDRIFMAGEEPPNFNELRRVLGEELRAQGLGSDWEDGILFEFARTSIWPNTMGGIFLCKSAFFRPGDFGPEVDETKSALLFVREVSSWAESNGSAHPYMKSIRRVSKHLASGNRFDYLDLIKAHKRFWNW